MFVKVLSVSISAAAESTVERRIVGFGVSAVDVQRLCLYKDLMLRLLE